MAANTETLCQWTGLPFTGRGKNHPGVRAALQDAFELNVYEDVTAALLAERARNPDTDLDGFRKTAAAATAAAVLQQHGFAVIDEAARAAIYTATRRATPRGALLLEHGYAWRRAETAPGEYSWQLYDPQGRVTTSTAALAVVALTDAEAVQMVEHNLFVTTQNRALFRQHPGSGRRRD